VGGHALGPTALYGSPYVLYGTLISIRERLLRRRDKLGISYYTIPSHAMESMAPLVEALRASRSGPAGRSGRTAWHVGPSRATLRT